MVFVQCLGTKNWAFKCKTGNRIGKAALKSPTRHSFSSHMLRNIWQNPWILVEYYTASLISYVAKITCMFLILVLFTFPQCKVWNYSLNLQKSVKKKKKLQNPVLLMYIVQTFTGFAHRDKLYWFKVQTGKDIAWSIVYLGAGFLQKRRIHFPPADAKMQIKWRFGAKNVSSAIAWLSSLFWVTTEYFLRIIVLWRIQYLA